MRSSTTAGLTAVALMLAWSPVATAHSMGITVDVSGDELVVRVGFGKSMRPAPDVQVSLLDASRRVLATGRTDQTGVVRLPCPPQGRYRLEALDGDHEADAAIDVPERQAHDTTLRIVLGDRYAGLRNAGIAVGLLAVTLAALVLYARRRNSREGTSGPTRHNEHPK